jgi:hypothetical protein
MTVLYHPAFPKDIKRFAAGYALITGTLDLRFRQEVDAAISAVIASPSGAGLFVNTGSSILREVRRRNLQIFPFFILYAVTNDCLVFGSLIPWSSNPLKWTKRFE